MPLEASAQMWPLSPRLPLARTSGHTGEPDGGGEAPQGAGPWAGRKTLFRERKRKTPAGRPCVDPEATGGTGGRGAWSGLATVTPRGHRERAGHPWAPPSCPAGDQSFSCPEDALPQQRMRVRGCIRGGEQCGSAGTLPRSPRSRPPPLSAPAGSCVPSVPVSFFPPFSSAPAPCSTPLFDKHRHIFKQHRGIQTLPFGDALPPRSRGLARPERAPAPGASAFCLCSGVTRMCGTAAVVSRWATLRAPACACPSQAGQGSFREPLKPWRWGLPFSFAHVLPNLPRAHRGQGWRGPA